MLNIGAIVNVKSFRIADLGGDGALIREHVSKEEMCKTLELYSFKRNLKKMARILSQRIVRFFLKKIIDHMMESHRIILPYGRSMYIGVMPERKENTVNMRFLNLHTAGKVYGIKLEGTENHNYHFKMNPKRRQELKNRLHSGQEFYE